MILRLAVIILSVTWISQTVALGQAPDQATAPFPTADKLVSAGSAGALILSEKLQSFDEQAVEVRWTRSGWQLWAGQVFLKDFGKKEADARTAMHLIRELHLNARGRLGAPQAVAEYWLSAGQPPRVAPEGARILAFDPASLSVTQENGQWMLRERRRRLLSFAGNEGEARRALAVFEYYHFDRVAYVGEPTPTFMYFLSGSDELQTKLAAPDAASAQDPQNKKNRPIHVLKAGEKPAGQKGSEIDPRLSAQLLPPGRQLLQVTSIPGQTNPPGRIPFNWQGARLHKVGDTWELVAQDVTIARFGFDEAAAGEALALLRHYHFTELCLVGGDEPCFSYLLVNGRLPRELRFGLSNIAFQPERVQVLRSGSDFIVEQDGICIHNFGAREDAAQSLCEFVRQNNPDHLCWVGPDPDHGMVFFVRRTLAPFNSGNDAPRKP